jgi:hypothetical protein
MKRKFIFALCLFALLSDTWAAEPVSVWWGENVLKIDEEGRIEIKDIIGTITSSLRGEVSFLTWQFYLNTGATFSENVEFNEEEVGLYKIDFTASGYAIATIFGTGTTSVPPSLPSNRIWKLVTPSCPNASIDFSPFTLESLTPGVTERIGFEVQNLDKQKIFCSITAYFLKRK